METVWRESVRVVCVDEQSRVLVLRWRDRVSGACLWEPPGGGIEPGERPIDAARRELEEETGFPGASVAEPSVPVHRDLVWNGKRFIGTEPFFLARIEHPPPLRRDGLMPYEIETLEEVAWVPWSQLERLPDPLEPPTLVEVLTKLAPDGPWAEGPA